MTKVEQVARALEPSVWRDYDRQRDTGVVDGALEWFAEKSIWQARRAVKAADAWDATILEDT